MVYVIIFKYKAMVKTFPADEDSSPKSRTFRKQISFPISNQSKSSISKILKAENKFFKYE